MILGDPYAMHRKWWDWTWQPGVGDTDFVDWDYILATVMQTIDDYTDKNSGQWMPFDQSGDVDWDVKSTFSGATAAIEKEQKERGDLDAGESLYAVPSFRYPDKKPTLASWAKDMEEDKADLRPTEARDSRPPTPAEVQKMLAAGRAKLKDTAKLE